MKVRFPPPFYLLNPFPASEESPPAVLRRYYCRQVWRERALPQRLALFAALLAWPFMNAWIVARFVRRNGIAAREKSGVSLVKQAIAAFRLSARYGLTPREYYGFELFRDEHGRRAAEYLNRYETDGELIRCVQKQSGRGSPPPMTDKEKFTADCIAANLPVIPIFLIAERGALRLPAGARACTSQSIALPECDLFLKPLGTSIQSVDTSHPFSAARWDYIGERRYRGQGGEVLDHDQLAVRIKQLSAASAYLVQPRLQNHADLADLSIGALSSVTIQTFLDEHDTPEVVAAVFHTAAGKNALADNAALGGLVAAVDLDRGTLGPATDNGKRSKFEWHDTHPETGAGITGRALPLWQEALDLACRAHAAFPGHLVIGWDTALTPDGPMLIEGDPRGYVTLKQRAYAKPYGTMRYGQLFAHHITRLDRR